MVVGVVVPVFNQLTFTKLFLHSLSTQILPESTQLIVIVIDNASTDGTQEFLELWKVQSSNSFASAVVITNSENVGFAKAVNQGLQYFLDNNKKYSLSSVLVANNDMELDPNCIQALITASATYKDGGVFGGQLFLPDGRIQHAGALLGVYGWGVHKFGGVKDEVGLANETIEEQEYVTGALFYITAAALSRVPQFDPRFSPAYFEEVDYCYELRKVGLKSYYVPAAKAVHYESKTSNSLFAKKEDAKVFLSDTNQIKFYAKRDQELRETFTSDNRLLMNCKIYGEWSFSKVMRNLAKGLSRAGVDVSIAPEEYHQPGDMPDWEVKQMILKPNDYWNRVALRSCEGDQMYQLPASSIRIAHTTGESSYVNRSWISQLNHVDKVLTTSTFFANRLLEHGLKTPIDILPNSVDLSVFKPENPLGKEAGLVFPNKKFKFYSNFHFGDRKNPVVLIKAFIEEFSEQDDTMLFLHSPNLAQILHQAGMDFNSWIVSIAGVKSHAPILSSSSLIQERVMSKLFNNFDCLVLPTRGEGFGIPVIEAAALKIPSIVTNYSGVTDFVTDATGWLIDYKLIDIPLQKFPYFKNYVGGQWADADKDHLRSLLRYAYEHPEEVAHKGEEAYKKVQAYSIEAVGDLAKRLIFT